MTLRVLQPPFSGAACGIRTHDLPLTRRLLWPTELRRQARTRLPAALLALQTLARHDGPVDEAVDDPATTLERERCAVLEHAHPLDAPMPAPTFVSTTALHPLPPAVAAVITARSSLGLAPYGRRYPRRRVWARTVVPAGLLALLCLGYCVYTASAGRGLVAVGAGMLFLPFTALVVVGWRHALGDPYRLGRDPRQAIEEARRWTSRQDWSAPLDVSAARVVLPLAADAIGRIASAPAWTSDRRADDRARVDLLEELDALDEELHDHGVTDGVVTRIAALRCYAAHLESSVPEGMTLSERVADRDRFEFFLDAAS